MSNIKRNIKLSQNERKSLLDFVSKGEHPSMLVRRANIILALDTSYGRNPENEAVIASRYHVSRQTVQNIKNDYLELGADDFLYRRKRATPPVAAKVDGDFEARLIALSCSEPPDGYGKWSVRLLADRVVELGYIDSISHMTINRVLKKTNSNRT